jgi:hypothetical protein
MMIKKISVRRAGAYVVKSAESRPSRVVSKTSDGFRATPSADDKSLVATLRRTKARKSAA